jgi:hypothetical protein
MNTVLKFSALVRQETYSEPDSTKSTPRSQGPSPQIKHDGGSNAVAQMYCSHRNRKAQALPRCKKKLGKIFVFPGDKNLLSMLSFVPQDRLLNPSLRRTDSLCRPTRRYICGHALLFLRWEYFFVVNYGIFSLNTGQSIRPAG